jgi:hypothetical protein
MADALSGTPLNSASAIATEMEKVMATVYQQFVTDDTFYSKVPTKRGKGDGEHDVDVSLRLVRIPILAEPGATFAQFFPDGTTDSMGTGGGSIYDVGVTVPVFFVQSGQVTKAAEWGTEGDGRSVVDVFKAELKLDLTLMRSNIEGMLCSSSGAGELGYVATPPPFGPEQNYLAVDDANRFQAGVTYQVVSANYGTVRGTILVASVDPIADYIYLTEVSGGYSPSGTEATDWLIVSGATGAQTETYAPDRYTSATVSESLNGVPAINNGSDSGDWFGIPKSTYGGLLYTPTIAASNGPLTPQLAIQLQSIMQKANGVDMDDIGEITTMMNVDQTTAWELLGMVTTTNVATAFTSQEGDDKGARKDYVAKERVKSFCGMPLIVNIKALLERIDLMALKFWFMAEVKPVSLYDVGGITTFWLNGSDGGVAPVTAFYYVAGFQLANQKARAGGSITGLALPSGWSL